MCIKVMYFYSSKCVFSEDCPVTIWLLLQIKKNKKIPREINKVPTPEKNLNNGCISLKCLFVAIKHKIRLITRTNCVPTVCRMAH